MPSLALNAKARAASLAAQLRGIAVAARLAEYRPPPSPDVAGWADRYESGGWDYLGGIHQLNQYSILVGYLGFLDPRSILDVGCGTGLLRERMNGLEFESYVGLDPVTVAIEEARRLTDERTRFIVGDLSHPDLGQFDAVIFNEVLYCVPQPQDLLNRARDVVRPGGHVLTSNLHHAGEAGLYRMIEEQFEPVAAVELRNRTDRGKRRRRVSVYRRA